MKVKKLTIQTFKEWLNVAVHSKKYRALRFLSVADFYRQLTGKEPRYKNPERYAFDYNKPFREWAKNIWKPFLGENYEKLGITNVSVSRSGLPLLFKPKKIKTLLDCMPKEFRLEFFDTRAFKFKDVKVIKEHRARHNFIPFPGKHKNVYYWVELENGYAVGWNENPSRGWSFPVVKLFSDFKVPTPEEVYEAYCYALEHGAYADVYKPTRELRPIVVISDLYFALKRKFRRLSIKDFHETLTDMYRHWQNWNGFYCFLTRGTITGVMTEKAKERRLLHPYGWKFLTMKRRETQ